MLVLAVFEHASLASAATLTWGTSGNGGGGTWTNANAWWDGTTQQTWSNATPDDAVFRGTGGTVALAGGTTTVGSITFDPFTGSYTIGTASQTLAITSGITLNSGAGAVTIHNSPLTLGAAQSWTNNASSLFTASSSITNGGNLLTVDGSGNTTLSGLIAGAGGITKTGNGTLTLSGVNTSYSGTTTVNGGLLTSNPATSGVGLTSFGTGPIVIGSSGTLQLTGSNGQASPSSYYVSGYTNTVSGSGTLQLLGRSSSFSVNYSGDLSGFTGMVSATAAANTYVGIGSSTNPSLSITGSNAKFVVSGAGTFVGVLGASGTIALGELSGNGNIWSSRSFNTTWEIGNLSTSSTFSGGMRDNATPGISSLRKVGSGTLTLSGSNSYTGATSVVGGVLQLGSETALSASTAVTVGGGTLDMQGVNETVSTVTLTSGSIIGSGTLTATTYSLGGGSLGVPLGAGTLNVTANAALNTTAAVTTVNLNSGTLTLGSGGRFTSSSVAVTGSSGGGLTLGGNETFGSLGGAARIALGSNTLTVGGANTTGTYSGIMSGAGNLTKDGTGTLTLSGTNTYSGTTTINGGLLTSPTNPTNTVGLTSFGASAIVIGSSGTLQLTGWNGQSSPSSFYLSGYTNTVSGSGTLRLVGQNNGASVNYSGNLSGFTGTVSATTAASTYVGVGSSTDATLNMTGSNAKFVVQGAGGFLGILGATGTIALGELSGNGAIQAHRDFNTTWEIGALSTSSTFSGGFADNLTGKSSLRKVGSGTLTLSGSSSFAGPGGTQLLAGGLTLGNPNALGASSNPLAVNGGTLDLAGQSITVGLFTGSAGGTITSNVVGTGTFTASSANSGTYAGSIADGLGTVAVAKAGAGTLTLSGSNSYTGATTISAGVLQIGSGATTGSLADASLVSLSSGATLAFNRSDALTYGGTVSGAGGLTKLGAGTLTLSGSNSYTGGTQINAGALALASADAIGSSGTISFGGGTLQFSSANTTDYSSRFSTAANQAFALDTNGQNVTVATGLSSTGGTLTKLGSGTLSLSGSNSYTAATTISAGVLQIGTGGTTGSLATTSNVSVASGASLAFNRSDALTYGGTVSGAGSVIKLGSNTLTLSAANTFAGGATISDGLVIGSNRSSFGTGTISLGASGTARLTAAASGTSAHPVPAFYSNGYTNAVSGSGILQLVSGANSYSVNYSGDLSSFTGTVSATNASGQYTGIGNTTSPALNLTGSNTKFFVTGPGQFLAILTSSGTIVMGELSGDGTIVTTNSATAGLNTTWQIGSLATSSTFSGRFQDNNQGKSILAKVGSGTLTLTGSSTFSGGTQLNAGTLVVGHANALGTGTVTLGGGLLQSAVAGTVANPIAIPAASGTFDSQSNANTLSGAISGTGSFVKVGSGTLTLSSAANSFAGTTRIGAGALTVGNAAALSASTLDMNAGDSGTITFNQNSTLGGLAGSRDLDMGTRTLSIGNNGQSTTYSGLLSNGGLTKVGSGTLTLTGSNAYAGNTTISAGRLALTGNGVLGSGSYAGTIALTNPAELFVGSDVNQILSGVISGTGSLTKDGAGTLALPASNTYAGTTTVNAGLLTSSSNAGATVRVSSFGTSQIVIGASGTVQLTGWNVQGLNGVNAYYTSGYTNTVSGSGTLQLVGQASSFSVNYSGNLSGFTGTLSATTSSGQYVGYGNSAVPSVNATGSNTRFVVSGAGTFLGVLGASGTLALGELSGNGSIISARTYNTTWEIGGLSTSSTFSGGFADNGVPGKSSLHKVGSGGLTLSGSSSYTGATTIAGGQLAIASGGRINGTSGITINGVGAELKYNSAAPLTKPLTLTQGMLSGTGTIATALAFGADTILSPGNSPGTLTSTGGVTWSPGGTYAWEINSLTGSAGDAWDLLAVTAGGLDLSGLSTGNRFTLDLITLTGGNTPGPLDIGYVPGSSYEFLIASFNTLSVPGSFSSAANSDLTGLFTVDLANWNGTQPAPGDISVKVNASGTGISLVIVPEPTAITLGVMGIAVAGWVASRSRRKAS